MAFEFSVARLPRIQFGAGTFSLVPDIIARLGGQVLLVTGARSFRSSQHWDWLHTELQRREIAVSVCTVAGEPSPEIVDGAVAEFREKGIDVVLGIGGGSALDAAKAIAGLLEGPRSVMDYLEGVGPELPYEGPAVPFVAVPTTAGTGSEATKNAVLSVQGYSGFKKSFRHELLVPDHAVVDPDLLASCPPAVIAANGMDALTQLIESYVSLGAGAFTDALVESGLRAVREGLIPWYNNGTPEDRERMAFASLVSGIALAQTGLGSVHGLASPLGAFFPIPHGVVCGTLVAEATRVNITSMLARARENHSLEKYARVSELLHGRHFETRQQAWDALISLLYDWTERLSLPTLADFGVTSGDLHRVATHARGGSMKTNPIELTDAELVGILKQRL
jgi:alcohol dehydrogenase